jgi:hypothetical protein
MKKDKRTYSLVKPFVFYFMECIIIYELSYIIIMLLKVKSLLVILGIVGVLYMVSATFRLLKVYRRGVFNAKSRTR